MSAIENVDTVIAGFHDQRDVQWIGGEDGRIGGDIARVEFPRRRDVVRRPDRRLLPGFGDIGRQRRDIRRQGFGEGRHLGRPHARPR